MTWKSYITGFKSYLKLERSLSGNSVEAYLHDISLLDQYLNFYKLNISPSEIQLKNLQDFLKWINELGMSANSQARENGSDIGRVAGKGTAPPNFRRSPPRQPSPAEC